MSGTSGPSLPVPFGFYDPDTRSLRTSRTTFDSASTLSCATLPTSGSMLSGSLYARTRSALPTSAAGSSSSPLLPTPRTSDTNGAGAHGEGGPDLRTAVSLLPTPRASDGEKGGPNQRGSKGDLALPSAVVQLLPTPNASDAKGSGATQGRTRNGRPRPLSDADLAEVATLLPTPTAADGDRTSTTYSRGNPTLLGAVSSPRSRDGKRQPAAMPPGQLTIEIDSAPRSSSG